MREFLPYLVTALIYAAVALDFWRCGRQPGAISRYWHSVAILAGLSLHGWLLYDSILIGGWALTGLNFDFTKALSLIFWLTVLIYWLTDIKQTYRSLQTFVLPPAALFVLLHGSRHSSHMLPYTDQPLFVTHLIIALLAYGLFTIAALHALLMAQAERSLHNKPSLLRQSGFPPLISMESLLFKLIGVGFLLLTLTVSSGMLFSEHIFQQPLKFNHKNVFAILSWFIYGGLLAGRYVYGWRGRKAIRWTLSGFVLLVLAYLGSQFVFQAVLHRPG